MWSNQQTAFEFVTEHCHMRGTYGNSSRSVAALAVSITDSCRYLPPSSSASYLSASFPDNSSSGSPYPLPLPLPLPLAASQTATLLDDDPPYDLEFRSSFDDAWYTARVVLDSDTLVVKFQSFYEWNDERFSVADFSTADAVYEFLERLRPLSQQLLDNHCSKVVEGVTVCAAFTSESDEIKYYDAVVEAVSSFLLVGRASLVEKMLGVDET